jgi:hypothetical protein
MSICYDDYLNAFQRLATVIEEAKNIFPIEICSDDTDFIGKIRFCQKPVDNVILEFEVYFKPIEYTEIVFSRFMYTNIYGRSDMYTKQMHRHTLHSDSDWRLTPEQELLLEEWYESV